MKLLYGNLEEILSLIEEKAIREESYQEVLFKFTPPTEWEDDYRTIAYKILSSSIPNSELQQRIEFKGDLEEGEKIKSQWIKCDDYDYSLSEICSNNVIIIWKKEEFDNWAVFSRRYGLKNMVIVSAKVPKGLSINFIAMCKKKGYTPSEQVRQLIKDSLEEHFRSEAQRLMFKVSN